MADEEQNISPARADLSSAEPITWLIAQLDRAERLADDDIQSHAPGSPARIFSNGRSSAFRQAANVARAAIAQATGEGR